MDLSKLLAQLHQELEYLDAAIFSLERLQHQGKRRGRPPKAASQLSAAQRAADKKPARDDQTMREGG
jgi:hypothetical protein